jgi:hypothetical protein
MMPKLIALARRRTIGSMPSMRRVEHLRRRHGVNVEPVGLKAFSALDVGDMGQHAQLDLAVIGETSSLPFSATKAWRILRPSSVRTGMFCRFGSDEDSRPVWRLPS